MKTPAERRNDLIEKIFNPNNEAADYKDRFLAEMVLELCRTIEEVGAEVVEALKKQRS